MLNVSARISFAGFTLNVTWDSSSGVLSDLSLCNGTEELTTWGPATILRYTRRCI